MFKLESFNGRVYKKSRINNKHKVRAEQKKTSTNKPTTFKLLISSNIHICYDIHLNRIQNYKHTDIFVDSQHPIK